MSISPDALALNWDNTDTTGGITTGTIKIGHYNFGSFLQTSVRDLNNKDVTSWMDKLAKVVDTDHSKANPISKFYTSLKASNISHVNPDGSRVQPEAGFAGGRTIRITMKDGPTPSSTTLGQWDIKHVDRLGAPAPALDATQSTDLNSMAFINLRNLWAYNAVVSGKISSAFFSTYHPFVFNNIPPAGCSRTVFNNAITALKQSIKAWYVLAKFSGNLYELSFNIDAVTPTYIVTNDRNIAAYNNYRNYWGAKALECGQFDFATVASYYTTVVNDVPVTGISAEPFNVKISTLKESIKSWYVSNGYSDIGSGHEKLRQLIEYTAPAHLSNNLAYSYDPNVDAFTHFKYLIANYIGNNLIVNDVSLGFARYNTVITSRLNANEINTFSSILMIPPPAPGVSEANFNTALQNLCDAIVLWTKNIVFWRIYISSKERGSLNQEDVTRYYRNGATYLCDIQDRSNLANTVSTHRLDEVRCNNFVNNFLNRVKPTYVQSGLNRFTDPLAPAVTVNSLGAKVNSGRKTVIPQNIIFKFNQMKKTFATESATYAAGWTGSFNPDGSPIFSPLIENTGFTSFTEKVSRFNNAINGTTSEASLAFTDYYQSSIELGNNASTTIVAPPANIPVGTTVYLSASIPFDTSLTLVSKSANNVVVRHQKNQSPYQYRYAVYSNTGIYLGESAGSSTSNATHTTVTINGFKTPTTNSSLVMNTTYNFAIIPFVSSNTLLYDTAVLPFNHLSVKTDIVAASGGGPILPPPLTDDTIDVSAANIEDISGINISIVDISGTSILTQVRQISPPIIDLIRASNSNTTVIAENAFDKAGVAGNALSVQSMISGNMGPTTSQGHTVSAVQLASTADIVHVAIELTPQTATSYSGTRVYINKYDSNGTKISSNVNNPSTFDTVTTTFNHIAPFTVIRIDDAGVETPIGTFDLSADTVVPTAQLPLTITGSHITINSLDTLNNTFEVTIHAPFSGIGGNSAGTPPDVRCLPAGTRVLTPTGYRAVETLCKGDAVVTSAGKTVPVRILSEYIASATEKNAPYLIPAKTLGPNQKHAVRLSPLHAVSVGKGLWEIPMYAAARYPAIRQYGIGKQLTYYHIETPNFFQDNLVIEGGVVVEAYAGRQCDGLKKLYTFDSKRGAFTRASPPSSSAVAKR